ncbi:MAG TPA: hypothetical protein PKX05_02815 [bacterium]|nr:hypothetical protein [bacterium]
MNCAIEIYPKRKIGCIDRNIYGHFIEHLGRCVYGGIYEKDSLLSEENNLRKDVLEAVKKVMFRFSDGQAEILLQTIDGWHREKRPKRFNSP